MHAIILAAGYATRMYPLTKDTPKPLLPVKGRPMLDHIINKISVLRLDGIHVVTNSRFAPLFQHWAYGRNINVIDDLTNSNETRRGAIGDIAYVLEQEKLDDDLLVVAGDNLFEFDMAAFHAHFRTHNRSVVALFDIHDHSKAANKFGIVTLDELGRIASFEEKPAKPATTLVSTACYLFTRDDAARIKTYMAEGNSPDNLGEYIKWLSKRTAVHGWIFTEQWYDIGSLEQYYELNQNNYKTSKPQQ